MLRVSRWKWVSALSVICASSSLALVIGDRGEKPTNVVSPVKASAKAPQEESGRVLLTSSQRQEALRLAGRPIRSMLDVDRPLQHGEYLWNENAGAGETWVLVNLRQQLLSVFRGNDEIGTAVILFGAEGNDTPTGSFPILAKIEDHTSSIYDAPMPYTLRLTGDGVSVHGSDVKEGRGTHGCIGVPTAFARRLFKQVEKGSTVVIVA